MNGFDKFTKSLAWFVAMLLVAVAMGCGSGQKQIIGGVEIGSGTSLVSLVSISVTPATASIPISGTRQFTATATYSDGSSTDVTASATWSSGTPANASVGLHTGIATGLISGTSVITATLVGKSATATLTISAATSVSFVVTPATASIPVSGTQQFAAIQTFSDGTTVDRTAASVWSTSGASAANASVGAATGKAVGITVTPALSPVVINATFGALVATPANLTVNAATPVSFVVTPGTASIPVSGNQQFSAIQTFSDGTTIDRTTTSVWSTSGASAANASVGAATGKAVGITVTPALSPVVINASFGLLLATPANLTVNAATSVSFVVTPATASIAVGGTQQFAAIQTFSDGTTQDRTTTSAWSTSGASAANASVGAATGKALGITVTPALSPVVVNASFGLLLATPANLNVTVAGVGPGPAGAAPVLGLASTYGIIASNAITGSAATRVFGDVALTLPTSTSTSVVGLFDSGVLPTMKSTRVTDSSGANPGLINTTDNGNFAILPQLQTDLQAAYNANKWGSPTRTPPPVALTVPPVQPAAGGTFPTGVVDLGGMVLGPGIYAANTGADTFALSTPLVLDAQGNPDAVFIFQASDITTTTGDVSLINGAQAKNVFWVMTATATIGTNTFFQGTIVTGNALTVNTGASVQGRMLGAATGAGALVVSGAVISVPK